MGSVQHDEAFRILIRILPRIDQGQVAELESLTGTQYDIKFLRKFRDLICASEYLWSAAQGDFEFIVGIQNIGWSNYNVWLISTEGMSKHIKFLLRELKKSIEYAAYMLNHEPTRLSAVMPNWFDAGHKLAAHFGFVLDYEENGSVTYARTIL